MKNLISVLGFILLSFTVSGQNARYQKAMKQAMTAFAGAKTSSDFNASANTFARIAANSESHYLPDYYAALALIYQSFGGGEAADRDQMVERALEHIAAAERLSPNNVELEVLRGFALTAKLVVDPATRGQQYGPMIARHYGKAMQMDPQNPRAAAMMARNELGTAQFFGSDPAKACAMGKQSLSLFEKETANGFEPRWGKEVAEEVASACK